MWREVAARAPRTIASATTMLRNQGLAAAAAGGGGGGARPAAAASQHQWPSCWRTSTPRITCSSRALWACSSNSSNRDALFRSASSSAASFAAAAAPSKPRRRRPAAAATTPAASATGENSEAKEEDNNGQKPQQRYALGQVMTSQANFVRVRVRRRLPPGAALPPLGDRDGDEALARLWSAEGEGEGALEKAPSDAPLLLCTVRGLLKKLGQPVLVGDRVVVATAAAAALPPPARPAFAPPPTTTTATSAAKPSSAERGVVSRVLPQLRPPLRDPPVSNADHVVLLLSLAQPPFEPLAASRFLVSVAADGLPVTVALNKCDLVGPEEAERRARQVRAWGYAEPGQVVCVSCETGEGVAALGARLLGGRTSVVAGPSGAGKSSLINALLALGDGGGGKSRGGAAAFREELEGMEQEDDDDLRGAFGDDDEEDAREGGLGDDDDDDLFGGSGEEEAADDEEEEYDASLPVSLSSGGPNALLAVGAVSARSGRGRHTTRTVTLVPVPASVAAAAAAAASAAASAAAGGGGAVAVPPPASSADESEAEGGLLADTPGFSMPSLDGVTSAGLGRLFPDFVAAQEAAAAAEADPFGDSLSASGSGSSSSSGCRFTDCLHVAEPGCAVLAAVEAALDAADAGREAAAAAGGGPADRASSDNGGDDDGDGDDGAPTAYVDPERLEHYYRFLTEARAREAEDVRAMQEAKRRREGATKAVVGRGGAVRQEARLNTQKHRAVSRRSGKQEAMRAMLSDEDDDGGDDGDRDGFGRGGEEGRPGGGGAPRRRGGRGGGGGRKG